MEELEAQTAGIGRLQLGASLLINMVYSTLLAMDLNGAMIGMQKIIIAEVLLVTLWGLRLV